MPISQSTSKSCAQVSPACPGGQQRHHPGSLRNGLPALCPLFLPILPVWRSAGNLSSQSRRLFLWGRHVRGTRESSRTHGAIFWDNILRKRILHRRYVKNNIHMFLIWSFQGVWEDWFRKAQDNSLLLQIKNLVWHTTFLTQSYDLTQLKLCFKYISC